MTRLRGEASGEEIFSERILATNLAALDRAQTCRPALAPLGPHARAVPDARAGLRVELRTGDEGWTPLDGDNPLAHAEGLIAAASAPGDLLLVGPGLGYLLDVLERERPDRRVLVIEPDPGIAVLFLSRRDWTAWFDSGRLQLVTGPDFLGASDGARRIRGTPVPTILVNQTQDLACPGLVAPAREVAARVRAEAEANADARRRFAGRYLLHTIQNLPTLAREGDVATLSGAFERQPAVLVAAGPSLDQSLPELASLQDSAVIIAADTTLRPLLAAGIRPHVVVAVDPAELNARHLHGSSDPSGTWLVAEGSLHQTAFTDFAGRTFTFKVSQHEPWPWLGSVGLARGGLRAWGSVATTVFDLALHLGCDPIVFVGHDFAYTGGNVYCSNTIFHEQWREQQRVSGGTVLDYQRPWLEGRPTVEVTDIAGSVVRTPEHLIAFRNWIAEQTTLRRERTFINASHGGILHGPHIERRELPASIRRGLGPGEIRQLLALRHARTKPVAARARTAAQALLHAHDTPDGRALFQRWSEFTCGTVAPADIREALDTCLRSWSA